MRICCAGEVMVEMAARDGNGLYQRGMAGDSFNTAVYLARAGLPVDYLTRLGDDPYSNDILRQLTHEGIGTGLITQCVGRQPGLYIIDNDAAGERRFTYWRDHAPARELFDQPATFPEVDVFYFTGITLAVTRQGFDHLLSLLGQLRLRGCRVVFDPNYRPGLWDGPQQAQRHYQAVLPLCDMALPTLEDEIALWGVASVDECRALYMDQGATELVVKGDDLTAHVFTQEQHIEQRARAVPALDTTGAGDAFNAGYLATRLTGGTITAALDEAQKLSAAVVQHRGAILPRAPGSMA